MTTKTLAEGLVAAQAAARSVEKDRFHDHHRYAYASAEAMITEGRAALAAGDVALLTLGWDWHAEPTGETPGRVIIRYALIHASGETREFTSSTWVVPGKGRPLDKAESGAITENLSYTLRGLLLLPRVDERVSVETREDGPAEQPATSPRVAAARSDDAVELRSRAERADDDELQAILSDTRLPKLPRVDQEDVLAAVACRGFALARNRTELESWVPLLKEWKLTGDARSDAVKAFAEAQERINA